MTSVPLAAVAANRRITIKKYIITEITRRFQLRSLTRDACWSPVTYPPKHRFRVWTTEPNAKSASSGIDGACPVKKERPTPPTSPFCYYCIRPRSARAATHAGPHTRARWYKHNGDSNLSCEFTSSQSRRSATIRRCTRPCVFTPIALRPLASSR